jgi:hypothetical protein
MFTNTLRNFFILLLSLISSFFLFFYYIDDFLGRIINPSALTNIGLRILFALPYILPLPSLLIEK